MTDLTVAPWVTTPPAVLLLLLLVGHVLADFLFQTEPGVNRQPTLRVLSAHAVTVVLSHAVTVLPFVRWEGERLVAALALLLLLGLLHALIDRTKTWLEKRRDHLVLLFVVDQAAHVGAVVGVWALWTRWTGPGLSLSQPDDLGVLVAAALLVAAYVLNGNGAATLIKLFLDRFPITAETQDPSAAGELRSMGRTIGILERMLILSLILLGQWQAVGWVFAGKTVTRFRELDDRAFAEYYLIGTFSSLLFATASGSAVRLAVIGSL